jgi:PAS domain-containing protein
MPPEDFDENARKQAEERLRAALDSVGDGSWDWNIRSGEVFFSDRWYESLGYRRGELGPGNGVWNEVFHPEDAPNVESALEAHLGVEVSDRVCPSCATD